MTILRDSVGSSGERGGDGFIFRERIVAQGYGGANVGEAVWAALLDPLMPKTNDSRVFGVAPDDVTVFLRSNLVRAISLEQGGTTTRIEFEALWAETQTTQTIAAGSPDDDGEGVTTVGAVVETVQTEFDRNGVEITVRRDANSPLIIQPVEYRRPRPVLEFSRWENSNPRVRADTYVGKINQLTWNGYAAETVLCTSIVGTSRDNGDTFDVRYEFEVDPNGWDATVVFIDEDSGRPIAGLVPGESLKTVELYTPVSFADLNITL